MLTAYTVIEVDNYYRSFFFPEIKTPKFYGMETHLKRWRHLHKLLPGYIPTRVGFLPYRHMSQVGIFLQLAVECMLG